MKKHHAIEISPPDIAPYRAGNTGVDYVHVLDSGKAGPNVMVQALTHGNEFCGAIALDFLFKQGIKPIQGKLTLAFANVAAYARFDFDDPDRSRCIDEDYNRVWGDEALLGSRDSAELRRARELRPFVDAADYLLDLHSMHEPCRPIMVCGAQGKGGAKSAADVAVDTLFRFLLASGAVSASICKSHARLAPPAVQGVVRVTEPVVAKSMNLRFPYPFKGLEIIPQAGTVVATDGATVWMTPYDDCVLVMPSLAHVKPGNTVLRLGRYE